MRAAGLDPVIPRSERALWKLYLEDPQYGSLGYDGHHDWPLLQGRYTLAVLFEYAATSASSTSSTSPRRTPASDYRDNWGGDYLDQLSRYDGLSALRLNPWAPTPPASRPPTPQPRPRLGNPARAGHRPGELRHRRPRRAAPADALLLDAFADRKPTGSGRLTTASLLRALDAGRTLTSSAATWSRRASHPLPQTVTTLLDDTAAASARSATPARST